MLVPGVSNPIQTNKRAFIDLLVFVEIVNFGLECVEGCNNLGLGAIDNLHDVSAVEGFTHELLSLLSCLSSFWPLQYLDTVFDLGLLGVFNFVFSGSCSKHLRDMRACVDPGGSCPEHGLQQSVCLLWLVARNNLLRLDIDLLPGDTLRQLDQLDQEVDLRFFLRDRLSV